MSFPEFPILLSYKDKFDESIQFYVYLKDLVNRIGQRYHPPIFVEYYKANYDKPFSYEEFICQCTDFIKTLSEVQKTYPERLACLGPPPYWSVGTSVAKYQENKYL